MTDREYFERHLDTMIVSESGLAHAIVRDADDDYKTAWVNQQWVTWQAALACRLVPESVVVPPARKWVGLTDSDINKVMENSKNVEDHLVLPYGYARDIEAKLKERNQ